MAKGHRSQIKRERNAQKDTRPSAKISYARVSVQKACFVLDAIRGKDVQTALGILAYNPRYASSVIEKLLKSAIANAENNNGMSVENLYIEECYANKGPTMKRIRPRAQGRAYRIEKRMSHITIVQSHDQFPYFSYIFLSAGKSDISILLKSNIGSTLHCSIIYMIPGSKGLTPRVLAH